MSDTPKTRTITLTGRVPVRIREDHWPVIARAEDNDSSSGIPSQWNRRHVLFLREHQDGRRILYGKYETHFQGDRDLAGGEMLAPGEEVASAARRVCATLCYEGELLVNDLLADMPAEEVE
jgi:hypothetical protein